MRSFEQFGEVTATSEPTDDHPAEIHMKVADNDAADRIDREMVNRRKREEKKENSKKPSLAL